MSPRLRSSGRSVFWVSRSCGVGGEAGDVAHGQAARRPGSRPRRRRRWHDLGEALVADEDLGSGVLHDVGDLGRHQVVVDGDDVPARLHGGEVDLEHLGAVGQHEGDGVARAEPELAQGVHDLVGPAEQLARLELGPVGGHQGQVARAPPPPSPRTRSRSSSLLARRPPCRRSLDARCAAGVAVRSLAPPAPATSAPGHAGASETRTCSRSGQAAPRPACAARRRGSWRSR